MASGPAAACARLLLLSALLCALAAGEGDAAEEAAAKALLLTQPRRAAFARYYPPRDLLNCDGANFSSAWRDFRLLAVANARAGFPRDPALYEHAAQIVREHEPNVVPGSLKFPQVLLRQALVTKLEGFCLYGYATALFIVFRHTLQRSHLLSIEQALGWVEWPLDFSESSEWPTLWRIAALHIEHARRLGDTSWSQALELWGDDEGLLPRPRLEEVHGALLGWLREVGAPARWEPAQGFAAEARELRELCLSRARGRGGGRRLGVWVLGHHLGSSFEPYSMLRRALAVGVGLRVEASFVGQRHPKPGLVCREFGFCDQDADMEDWFRRYESRWLGEYDWMPHGWDEASGSLAAAVRASAFAPRTDLVICGGPAWFCAMLRTAWPLPMLLYFAWPIAPLVPAGFRSQVFAMVRALGQTLAPPTVIVAANWVLAAQFALQVQLQVPVQRPHGLYVNQSYAPRPGAGGRPRVVVTRIGHWARTGGIALLELTWSFLEQERKEAGRRYPFELVFLSIRVRKTNTNVALSYADFAGFHACIFWPWDVMMLLFDELYTMTMPLLVPARRWMHTLMVHALQHTDVNWWHLRAGNVEGGLPFVRQPDFPLALPWVSAGDGLAQAAYWYELTDFAQFPHVTAFESLPDMLERLRALDATAVRRGMAAFNAATFRGSLAFYRAVAAELLG